jgi:hypothetical protein
MTPFADWGTLLLETDLDRLVIARLRMWLPTYLSRAEDERDLANGLLARPVDGAYENTLEDDTFPDSRLPAVLVTTAQTEGNPSHMEGGRYAADWRCNVSVIVRGRTPSETREIASVFGGCVRRILIQQQLSDDIGVLWRASNVAPVVDQTDQGRYLAAALNRFTLLVNEAVSGDGPIIPTVDDPPYPPPGDPNETYDPLLPVTNVTTTIETRS